METEKGRQGDRDGDADGDGAAQRRKQQEGEREEEVGFPSIHSACLALCVCEYECVVHMFVFTVKWFACRRREKRGERGKRERGGGGTTLWLSDGRFICIK